MIRRTGLPNEPAAGDVFSCWVRATGGANKLNVTYGVQDHKNRYYVHVDFNDDEFMILKYQDGESILLDKQTSGFTLSEDAWYQVIVDWRTNNRHVATLSTNNGPIQLSGVDSTWTRGGIGFDAYLSSSGGTVYFDHFTMDGHNEPDAGLVIDDFEDGDLDEYVFDRGSSGATVQTQAAYYSSHALKLSDTTIEAISTSGLNTYPNAGDTFRLWVLARNGAGTFNFAYGVQDHDNRYLVQLNFDENTLKLFRYEGAQAYLLAKVTSGFCLAADEWYRLEIDWRNDGGHTATLINGSEDRLGSVSGTDSMWTNGGVGFDAYLSSGDTIFIDGILVDGLGKRIMDKQSQHGLIQSRKRENCPMTVTKRVIARHTPLPTEHPMKSLRFM
jgi:hypothetical protein